MVTQNTNINNVKNQNNITIYITPGLNSIKTFCGACLKKQHFNKTEASLSTLSFIRTFLIGGFLK